MYSEKYQRILDEVNLIRPNNPPVIISVSKTYPKEIIDIAYTEGIRIFGENKVKEGIEKFSTYIDEKKEIEIHHIGPLQSGTLKKVLGFYSYTHGVCSISNLQDLQKYSLSKKSIIKYFLQINLTHEDSKSGFTIHEIPEIIKSIEDTNSTFAILEGFMTMGPSDGNLDITRKVFSELNEFRNKNYPKLKLSMGMSGDFKIACEEGSNYIRIGSSIFGNRS